MQWFGASAANRSSSSSFLFPFCQLPECRGCAMISFPHDDDDDATMTGMMEWKEKEESESAVVARIPRR